MSEDFSSAHEQPNDSDTLSPPNRKKVAWFKGHYFLPENKRLATTRITTAPYPSVGMASTMPPHILTSINLSNHEPTKLPNMPIIDIPNMVKA